MTPKPEKIEVKGHGKIRDRKFSNRRRNKDEQEKRTLAEKESRHRISCENRANLLFPRTTTFSCRQEKRSALDRGDDGREKIRHRNSNIFSAGKVREIRDFFRGQVRIVDLEAFHKPQERPRPCGRAHGDDKLADTFSCQNTKGERLALKKRTMQKFCRIDRLRQTTQRKSLTGEKHCRLKNASSKQLIIIQQEVNNHATHQGHRA